MLKLDPERIQPLGNYLLVEEHKLETGSKLELPDGAGQEDIPVMGTVLATGPGYLTDSGVRAELTIAKGDTIGYFRMMMGRPTCTKLKTTSEKPVMLIQEGLVSFRYEGGVPKALDLGGEG